MYLKMLYWQRRQAIFPSVFHSATREPKIKSWDEFDLQYTLYRSEFTSIVSEKGTSAEHILQFCKEDEYSLSRAYLVEIAKENNFFISTHFDFIYNYRLCWISGGRH